MVVNSRKSFGTNEDLFSEFFGAQKHLQQQLNFGRNSGLTLLVDLRLLGG